MVTDMEAVLQYLSRGVEPVLHIEGALRGQTGDVGPCNPVVMAGPESIMGRLCCSDAGGRTRDIPLAC